MACVGICQQHQSAPLRGPAPDISNFPLSFPACPEICDVYFLGSWNVGRFLQTKVVKFLESGHPPSVDNDPGDEGPRCIISSLHASALSSEQIL